ncbi:MAG: hypothetical protein ACO3EE_06705, partial [Flavobacteriales bacterium]
MFDATVQIILNLCNNKILLMKKLVFAILLALTPTLTLLAQDPVFTQAYSAGMYLNPALAGEQKGFKLN